jgi:toxin ParE1/3/4
MPNYQFTRKAVEDLENIWNYTFDQWSEKQADSYYSMLIESCAEIAQKPSIGKEYENITSNLQGYALGKHIIFYRETSKEYIEITRVLHGQMDLGNRIKE